MDSLFAGAELDMDRYPAYRGTVMIQQSGRSKAKRFPGDRILSRRSPHQRRGRTDLSFSETDHRTIRHPASSVEATPPAFRRDRNGRITFETVVPVVIDHHAGSAPPFGFKLMRNRYQRRLCGEQHGETNIYDSWGI